MKIKILFMSLLVVILCITTTQAQVSQLPDFWLSIDSSYISGTTVIDDANNTNGTYSNGAYEISDGLLNEAMGFDSTDDTISLGTPNNMDTALNADYSWWFWVNKSAMSGNENVFRWQGTGYHQGLFDGTNLIFTMGDGVDWCWTEIDFTSYDDDAWHSIAFVKNISTSTCTALGSIFIDGVKQSVSVNQQGGDNEPNRAITWSTSAIGSDHASSNSLGGGVDEFGFWKDYALTQEDVDWLHNSGSGDNPFRPAAGAPSATMSLSWDLIDEGNYSSDDLSDDELFINFTGDCQNCANPSYDCILYINGTANQSQFSLNFSQGTYDHNFTVDFGQVEQSYAMNISCTPGNPDGDPDDDITAIINVDTILPELIVNANVVNNSVVYRNIDDLEHQFNVSDGNLYAVNVSYMRLNGDGSLNLTLNTSFVENINETIWSVNFTGNETINLVDDGYINGSYKIEFWAWDSHTAHGVRPIYWNLSEPDKIKVEDFEIEGDIKEEKTEFLLSDDRYKFKITWNNDETIHLLNLTATGDLAFIPGSDYKGHFVHFSSKRWIDFVSPNIKDVFVEDLGNNKYQLEIHLYQTSDEVEFDSIGDLNVNSEFYYFTVKEPFTVFAVDVFTNATVNNFTVNVFNASDYSLIQTRNTTDGSIEFNITTGIEYLTNFTSDSHANNETGNITFTEGGNMTYYVFATNSLYLFVYDEITDTLITDPNVTIRIINYDNSTTEQETSGGSLFYSGLSAGSYELRYTANGYNTRSYYTTITDSSTQSIDLFLLSTGNATYTSFIIEDETGNTLEGTTLQAYRHFIDCNCFQVIEMDKSTFNGIATLSLQHHEARYRFIVLGTDGSTIYSSTSNEGYKITDTAYTLTATLLGDTTQSFFGTSNLFTNLSWSNATKSFYFTVNDPTALVDQFCVYVNQYDNLASSGKNEVCSNCINASTGTAVCNVTAYYDDGKELIAQGWIHTNTEFSEYWTDVISVFTDLEAVQSMGLLGVFLGTVLVLTGFFAGLVLAGLGGAIIVFDIVLIFVSTMKLIMISFPVLLGIIAVSIFVLMLMGDK